MRRNSGYNIGFKENAIFSPKIMIITLVFKENAIFLAENSAYNINM
jgi:hypothetical protein